jgi:hypothetical protein
MSKFFTQHWHWSVALFALLWVSAEARCWHLRQRLGHLWVKTVAIKVVDGSSGRPLPCSIGDIPGREPNRDYLPWVAILGSTSENRGVTVASDGAVTLKIGSDGYQPQPVTISSSTSGEVIVRLEKE